jgi:hypothetical protein
VATRCRVIPGRPALLGGGGGLGGVVGESYHHGGFSLHPAPPELGSNSAWWECRRPRRVRGGSIRLNRLFGGNSGPSAILEWRRREGQSNCSRGSPESGTWVVPGGSCRCSAVEGWPSSRKCHGVLSSRIRSLGLPGAQEPPWLNPPRTPLVPNYSLNVASLQ